MERVSVWPWYSDNSKDKKKKERKQHFYKHVQFIYPLSACKEVSALSTRDTIKRS